MALKITFALAILGDSPHPIIPLSVVILTIISVIPERDTLELISSCLYGTDTGKISILSIFIKILRDEKNI